MMTDDEYTAAGTHSTVSPKTAFVTGATGFLGLNLIGQLTDLGWKVFALHRTSSNLKYLQRFPVQLVEGSVEDGAALERAFPEGVTAVFHIAADVSFWSRHNARQTKTNVDGTRHLVAAALRHGVRKLIHTSTTGVYGFPSETFDESAPHLGKQSWFNYFRTKALAEEEVRLGIARGLDAVLLNPANIVGPYDGNNWSRLIRLAAEGKLPRVPPGRASFCHVAEVARRTSPPWTVAAAVRITSWVEPTQPTRKPSLSSVNCWASRSRSEQCRLFCCVRRVGYLGGPPVSPARSRSSRRRVRPFSARACSAAAIRQSASWAIASCRCGPCSKIATVGWLLRDCSRQHNFSPLAA